MNGWLLGLVLLTGCQGCTAAPELDLSRPAFSPSVDFVGWVEGLPRQPAPRTYFGCDLRLGPCNLAGLDLHAAVSVVGDEVRLIFLPSLFCAQVLTPVTPIDHFTRMPTVTAALAWNEMHQSYEAHGDLSLSAPGADLCWEGSSVIFSLHWEVRSSPLPARSVS